MSLYGVNLENLQQANNVIRQHQPDLEGRILPELRTLRNQDYFLGDAGTAQEAALQDRLGEATRAMETLTSLLQQFEQAAQHIVLQLE